VGFRWCDKPPFSRNDRTKHLRGLPPVSAHLMRRADQIDLGQCFARFRRLTHPPSRNVQPFRVHADGLSIHSIAGMHWRILPKGVSPHVLYRYGPAQVGFDTQRASHRFFRLGALSRQLTLKPRVATASVRRRYPGNP